jgi:hypothetical protein
VKLERRPDGSLRVRHDPTSLRLVLAAFGLAVLAAVWLQQPPADATARALGTLGALLPISMAALVERCAFDFDATRRRLQWSRRNLLRTLRGELGFDELRDAVVRTAAEIDSDSRSRRVRANYRVVLVTAAAGDLELSNRRFYDEPEQAEIAGAIRAVLGR